MQSKYMWNENAKINIHPYIAIAHDILFYVLVSNTTKTNTHKIQFCLKLFNWVFILRRTSSIAINIFGYTIGGQPPQNLWRKQQATKHFSWLTIPHRHKWKKCILNQKWHSMRGNLAVSCVFVTWIPCLVCCVCMCAHKHK